MSMTLKRSKDIRELCYPFIYELEDDERFNDIYDFLCQLQPMMFHLNASIRVQQAIFEEQIQWVLEHFERYQQEINGRIKGFVLLRGLRPVQLLHTCRSLCKKAIRVMVLVDAHGIVVPDELHRLPIYCVICFSD